MKALLIEQDDLIATAVGKQLALAKIMHDRTCVHDARIDSDESGYDLEDYDAIIIGSVTDSADFVARLRNLKTHAAIICLLEHRCTTSTVKILRAGADDVLVKPVVSAEIRARIEATQRRTHGHTTNAISVGRLTVYLDGRDPEIDGVRLRLSQREHAILSVLALHHRRVVSKEHIYESVYGLSESEPLDKVIDVYICKLRKKIAGATGGGRYIETVYGRGYKFEAPSSHAAPEDVEESEVCKPLRKAKRLAMVPARTMSRWNSTPLALRG